MRSGHNSDVKYGATVYHIQTEDRGADNPLIETLVYVGGQILDALRTPYQPSISGEEIDALLEKQHKHIIKKIIGGAYDLATKGKEDTQSFSAQRGLDEMVLNYLAEESAKEHLELDMNHNEDFIFGRDATVEIYARNDRTREPIADVNITVKMICTEAQPAVLFEGKTNSEGKLRAVFTIPEVAGNAAVIIKGVSSLGSDELKGLVKRVKS